MIAVLVAISLPILNMDNREKPTLEEITNFLKASQNAMISFRNGGSTFYDPAIGIMLTKNPEYAAKAMKKHHKEICPWVNFITTEGVKYVLRQVDTTTFDETTGRVISSGPSRHYYGATGKLSCEVTPGVQSAHVTYSNGTQCSVPLSSIKTTGIIPSPEIAAELTQHALPRSSTQRTPAADDSI